MPQSQPDPTVSVRQWLGSGTMLNYNNIKVLFFGARGWHNPCVRQQDDNFRQNVKKITYNWEKRYQ